MESPAQPRAGSLEIVATVLLALAAVATAWSSYQASRWTAEQTKAGARANALRIEAARTAGLASSQTEVDIATFIQWVDAAAHDDNALADFYLKRFRSEFRPAFDAWRATDPLANAAAPPTPFAMDEYRLAATVKAERLDAQAEVASSMVRRNVQRATNYVLGVVLFAVSLFFAGISGKLTARGPRIAMLVIGCVIFTAAFVWIATSPVSLAV